MTKLSNARILAIDPGTREMGIALIDRGELVYQGVRTIRRGGSPHDILARGRKVVLQVVRDFRPHVLAVEKTFFARNRNAALLNVLGDEICAVGRRQGLRVLAFGPSTIKKGICGNGHATKREVARAVVARYPELKVYLSQDRKWKERYHANMFDAVALALVAVDAVLDPEQRRRGP
jgi:crossover junction endodeoxyribonuclease RuvC